MLLARLLAWSEAHASLLGGAALSVLIYVAVALTIPVALARIPADYLTRPPREPRFLVQALRVVAGVLVAAAGVALLFLPGPGVLTILLGLAIMGGAPAARGVRALARRPGVLAAINEVRCRRGTPPLAPPHDST